MSIITDETIITFEQYLQENEKSKSTIEKYSATLRKLSSWLDGNELTKAGMMEYRDYMRDVQGFSVSTVNGALSAINAYLTLFGMEECRVKFLKCQRTSFRPDEKELTREEFFSLVQTARAQKNDRLALVMETLCGAGIRVSELQYISVEAALCGRTEITLKGKIRTIFLPDRLCRKLLYYAEQNHILSGEIFLTKSGQSLSRKQIWAEMKALCEAAGVEPTKVYPHNLRHLFAQCFYHSSCDIVQLADVLGHSSIETTRIYLMSTGKEHARTLDSLNLIS